MIVGVTKDLPQNFRPARSLARSRKKWEAPAEAALTWLKLAENPEALYQALRESYATVETLLG